MDFAIEELTLGTRVVWCFGGDEMIGRIAGIPVQDSLYYTWQIVVAFDDGGCHAVYVDNLRRPNALELLGDV